MDPGQTCHGTEIRNNTIRVARVQVPERGWYSPTAEDSTMVGTPITLIRLTEPRPGMPELDTEGVLEDILVQGNRLYGAEGVGILIQNASQNRIVENTITSIERREPFPGITWDGFAALWEAANGSGIWLSPGSNGNEIVGNSFHEIAGTAVFIESDSNRVVLQDVSDAVRNLGTGNRVTSSPKSSK